MPDMSAILVTEKCAMLYTNGVLKTFSIEQCLIQPLMIGSTNVVEVTVKGLGLNLSAIEMVYVGSLYSRSIGNGLDIYSLKTGKIRYIKDLSTANKQKIATMMADKIINGSLNDK
jgi:hypothetical protein